MRNKNPFNEVNQKLDGLDDKLDSMRAENRFSNIQNLLMLLSTTMMGFYFALFLFYKDAIYFLIIGFGANIAYLIVTMLTKRIQRYLKQKIKKE
jgi:hypothetical protein